MTREEAWAILTASSEAFSAQQRVQARLFLASTALNEAGVEYALFGGLAVAAWVRTADQGGDRVSPHVHLLLPTNRVIEQAALALQSAGFLRDTGNGRGFGENEKRAKLGLVRIHRGEPRTHQDLYFKPEVLQRRVMLEGIPTLALEDLVRNKLYLGRCIDRVHLRDLIGVGLVDASWLDRLSAPLAARLQGLLDDPEG